MQNKVLSHNCSNPIQIFTICKKVQICMTECVLIKGFKQSLSCTVSVSLTSRCKVSYQGVMVWSQLHISTLTTASPGWVTSKKVSGSSLPTSVFSRITSFPPFICTQDLPYFLAHHNVMKDKAENYDLDFLFVSHDDSFKPVPSTSFEPVDNRLLTQEGKLTSQESASTSESPGSNQAPVRNVDCHGGPHIQGYRK